jgi:hypothetical protein
VRDIPALLSWSSIAYWTTLSKVRDFPKSAGYLALLTARGTNSRFSDPALLCREVKVRELKSTHYLK